MSEILQDNEVVINLFLLLFPANFHSMHHFPAYKIISECCALPILTNNYKLIESGTI